MANYFNPYPQWRVDYPSQTIPYSNQTVPQYQYGTQPQQQSSIIWVQGEAGAKSYMVPAGQTVLLMDSETPRFFIKSTSPNGIPAKLRVFDYTEVGGGTQQSFQSIPEQQVERTQEAYATKDDLDSLRKLIEERLPERRQKENHNGKPSV